MNFSVNQNRQFYYVTDAASAVITTGDLTGGVANTGKLKAKANTNNNTFYVLSVNAKGEITRSDIINAGTITGVQAAAPTDSESKLKKALVVLDPDVNGGAPIAGEDYVLRINLRQYFGMSDDTTYVKDAAVHATSSMTATTFYAAMADALTKSFSRELEQPFTITSSASGILITENEGDWVLGTQREEPLQFDVYPTTVFDDGDEVIWGKVVLSGASKCTDGTALPTGVTAPTADSRSTLNSHKIADLEYFCMGERGDQYRNVGWPYVIPTAYCVDGKSTDGYYTLDVHYAYIGDGMENQASEKTMTFVCATKDNLDTIVTAIETLQTPHMVEFFTEAYEA